MFSLKLIFKTSTNLACSTLVNLFNEMSQKLEIYSLTSYTYDNFLINFHTMTQVFSEFWRLPGEPLVLEGHMDPIWIEFEVSMLLAVRPYEIEAPGIPEVTHRDVRNWLISNEYSVLVAKIFEIFGFDAGFECFSPCSKLLVTISSRKLPFR